MKATLIKCVSILTVLGMATYLLAITPGVGLGQNGVGLGQNGLPPAISPNSNNPAMPPANAGNPNAGVVAIAPAHVGSAGSVMMASSLLSNGSQQMVIYDQAKQTLAVYHIVPSTGDIQLKSVRKTDADFALQEYNLTSPTPSEIRANVQ